MPVDFPDMESLKMAAEVHKFRQPNEGEPEADYRKALANHVGTVDAIEAHEIRLAKGWDQWTPKECEDMVWQAINRAIRRVK